MNLTSAILLLLRFLIMFKLWVFVLRVYVCIIQFNFLSMML